MRSTFRIGMLVAVLGTVATHARADLIITVAPFSASTTSARGYASYDSVNDKYVGQIDKADQQFGTTSSGSGFDFDTGFGFSGSASSNASLVESHTKTSISLTGSAASRVVFANTSADGYSDVESDSSTSMQFSTDRTGVATLTWFPTWSLGTWNAGADGGASTESTLQIQGPSGNAFIVGFASSFGGVVDQDQLYSWSSDTGEGALNTVRLNLIPGVYDIYVITGSRAYFSGAGFITDPDSSGFGGMQIDVQLSSVPEPSTILSCSILSGIFAAGAFRKRMTHWSKIGACSS